MLMTFDNDDAKLLDRYVQRLLQVQTWGRWLFVLFLWLTLGTFCIWRLRSDIALWLEYFTWAAVRISLQYNRLTFLGIGLCLGLTLSTLIWQSYNILWGVSKDEYRSLVKQVNNIKNQGPSHPLWQWVCAEEN